MKLLATVTSVVALLALCATATAAPEGVRTGDLTAPRLAPALALLSDGRVLAASSVNANGTGAREARSEIYNPATGQWTTAPDMRDIHNGGQATTLANGDVLFTDPSTAAELYHPGGGWTATGRFVENLDVAYTQTLLADGRVLVTGGGSQRGEIYNPGTGQWRLTAGSMSVPRRNHVAILLKSGKVLLAGGTTSGPDGIEVLASAELYDPATDEFTATGTMTDALRTPLATTLPSGKVLVVDSGQTTNRSAEIYDPATGQWAATNPVPQHPPAGALLTFKTGLAGLVVPEQDPGDGSPVCGCQPSFTYDESSRQWSTLGSTNAQPGAVPILLKNGLVLVVGGGLHQGSGALGQTAPQVESTLAFAPETRVASSTFGASSASFTFDANDPMSSQAPTFKCSLDGDPYSACSSPRSYSGIDSGDHVFRVRAQGAAGKTDPTSAVVSKSGKTYPQLIKATSGLIHYWRLGEHAGTTAADAQDSSTPGTYTGTFQLGQGGALFDDRDSSVAVDGAGFVKVPSAGSFTTFTIEGWTRLNQAAGSSPNGNNTLFGAWGSVRLIVRPSGVYADEFVNGEKTAIIQTGTQGNEGAWVHWALVRDGSRMTVYRNGERVIETASVPLPPTLVSGLIGVAGHFDGATRTYYLHVRIDDVAIYNRALSQAEVHGHYVHFAP